jgi:energy-coupling factor transport system permease protein
MSTVRTVLARRAPVAKLAASALLSIVVLATREVVVVGTILVACLATAPLFGIELRSLARRLWPVLAACATIVVTLSLFSADRSGTTLLHFGPLLVTSSVLSASLSLALRLLALAVPAVLVFGSTDPTDLADSLIQHAKVPSRFAIGALAAVRMMDLFRQEWRMIAMARRARGVRQGFARTAFVLLVGAIRRGVRLSVAMDARGFDSGQPRTVARPQPFGAADAGLVVGAVFLAVLAFFLGTG